MLHKNTKKELFQCIINCGTFIPQPYSVQVLKKSVMLGLSGTLIDIIIIIITLFFLTCRTQTPIDQVLRSNAQKTQFLYDRTILASMFGVDIRCEIRYCLLYCGRKGRIYNGANGAAAPGPPTNDGQRGPPTIRSKNQQTCEQQFI